MAVAFARVWRLHAADTIKEFFKLSSDAEANHAREYAAAATIQKYWRGYVCRRFFGALNTYALRIQRMYRGYQGRCRANTISVELARERRMARYNAMATKIQKVWRGYVSRKHVFDFYARKRYIEEISKRIEHMRVALQLRETEQRTALEAQRVLLVEQKLDRAAGRRHHLVGTRAVPGVFARVRTSSATHKPDAIDERGHLAPLAKIPESKLKNSIELKKWIMDHVGKNPSHVKIKPVATPDDVSAESIKLAQGPFLPKHKLVRKILKPLRPTLRVETDFYDTHRYVQEERRRDISMRVSQRPFAARRQIEHLKRDYFLRDEPYVPRDLSTFRKEDRAKRLSNKDFKNVLAPIRLFDEVVL